MPERAATLAALIPCPKLDPAVLAWADIAGRSRWGVALSGGADSVALLLLLWTHWPGRRRQMVALHFDHRLRGRASRADAAFCRRLCAALGVRLVEEAWAGSHSGAAEAEAREARMGFFRKHAAIVWLGHQRDDVAETMLMRLARGSGTGGLAAPRPVQRFADGRAHLRPLLTLRHAEITTALRAAGVPWREDATNATGAHLRNRIRHDVLPRWERAAGRDAAAGAARSRRLLEEDDAALESWVEALRPVDARGRLQLARLRGRPRAIWRRALHHWILANPPAATLSRVAFDALLADVEAGRRTRHSAGRTHFAVCDGRWLELDPAPASVNRRGAGRIN